MAQAYRCDDEVFARRDRLLRERRREVAGLAAELVAVHRARLARVCAGVVATLGAFGVVLASLSAKVELALVSSPSVTLVVAPVLALCSYVVGHLVAPWCLRLRVAHGLERRSDVREELARLECCSIEDRAAAAIDRLEVASVAAPLVGIALLTPLLQHLAIWFVFASGEAAEGLSAFDRWNALSLVFAGPAHVALVVYALYFACKLSGWRDGRPRDFDGGFSAWGFTSIAGLVPGALLFLIPPAIVSATGLLFVPATFWAAEKLIARERDAVGVVVPGSRA